MIGIINVVMGVNKSYNYLVLVGEQENQIAVVSTETKGLKITLLIVSPHLRI